MSDYINEQRRLGNPRWLEPNEMTAAQLKGQIIESERFIASCQEMIETTQFRLAKLKAEFLKPKTVIIGGGKTKPRKKMIERRMRRMTEYYNRGKP